jgi:hypothetical protein
MSTVTPKLGLVKPTTLEQYALSVLNNNADLIDQYAMQVDYGSSSVNNGTWNFTGCRFTRVRTDLRGIVIVELILTLTAVVVPSNTAATLDVAGVIPSGYRPVGHTSIPVLSALTSNAGVGQQVGIVLKTDGTFGIRSQAAGFTATAGSQIYSQHVYRWDGIL